MSVVAADKRSRWVTLNFGDYVRFFRRTHHMLTLTFLGRVCQKVVTHLLPSRTNDNTRMCEGYGLPVSVPLTHTPIEKSPGSGVLEDTQRSKSTSGSVWTFFKSSNVVANGAAMMLARSILFFVFVFGTILSPKNPAMQAFCPECDSTYVCLGGARNGTSYAYQCRNPGCAFRWNQSRISADDDHDVHPTNVGTLVNVGTDQRPHRSSG
jgi:hypothetical protein